MKSATRSGSLTGRIPGSRGRSTPDATSTAVAGIVAKRLRDVGRVQATGEDDRHLAGDRGGEALRGARAGPTRMRPAGRVEHDPVDPGVEEGSRARHEVGRGAGEVGGFRGRELEDLPGPPPDRASLLDRFAAGELDDVGVDAGDDRREVRPGPRRP